MGAHAHALQLLAAVSPEPAFSSRPLLSMQELGQVDGVLSFWELSQSLVSRLAERLGLPANPPQAVDTAREKQVGRTFLYLHPAP